MNFYKIDLHNKSQAITLALFILISYLLSLISLPFIAQSEILAPKFNYAIMSAKKINTALASKIATATYINNGQMIARQINNNQLQSYVNNDKGSTLKFNDIDNNNVQKYNYDAYGNNITAPSLPLHPFEITTNIPNRFQYNNEPTDFNTKLQYLRARFFYLELKIFINQDVYNLLNRFNYVNGNPIMWIDPTGHMIEFDTICDYKNLVLGKNFFVHDQNLSGSTFKNAVLECGTFLNVRMIMADLSSASLKGSALVNVYATGAIFKGANLDGTLFKSDNQHTFLTNVDFSEAKLSPTTRFLKVNMFGAKLPGNLAGIEFTGSNLESVIFKTNKLFSFSKPPDISDANFENVDLIGSNFAAVMNNFRNGNVPKLDGATVSFSDDDFNRFMKGRLGQYYALERNYNKQDDVVISENGLTVYTITTANVTLNDNYGMNGDEE